ncbi:hypothetical protein JYU34_001634, partial [Plutella xylostella]
VISVPRYLTGVKSPLIHSSIDSSRAATQDSGHRALGRVKTAFPRGAAQCPADRATDSPPSPPRDERFGALLRFPRVPFSNPKEKFSKNFFTGQCYRYSVNF